MAIKIKSGELPSYGRITMPKGTYLSNPSTAASGSLGGPQGANPPPPTGMVPVGQTPVPQINAGSFTGFLQNLYNKYTQTNPFGQAASSLLQNPLNPMGNVQPPTVNQGLMDTAKDWITGTGVYGTNPDPFLASFTNRDPKSPTGALKAPTNPSNNLVGNGIGKTPARLDMGTLQQILPGKSFDEIRGIMELKGYEWLPYNGGFFANAGGPGGSAEQLATQQQTLLRDNSGRTYGNPFEIGPTLAPGERTVTAGHKTEAGTTVGSGVGVTGGTSYTDKNGNTVQQYAVSYGSGGDRWKYNIQKDAAGNWVRIYYRTFSKARSRSALKRKANNRENGRTPRDYNDNGTRGSGEQYNQLVNLRADFG